MWKNIYVRAFNDDLKISLQIMKKRFKMLNIKIEYEIIEDKMVGFCLLYNILRVFIFIVEYNFDKSTIDYLKLFINNYNVYIIRCKIMKILI